MFNEFILRMRDELKQKNANIDQQWFYIYDFISANLYKFYYNSSYNRFWTLEDPEYIAQHRLYNGNSSITIGDISNAFVQACDATDLHTTRDEDFLSVFSGFISNKTQVSMHVHYQSSL